MSNAFSLRSIFIVLRKVKRLCNYKIIKPYNFLVFRKIGPHMSSKIAKYPPAPTYKMPGKLIRQFICDPIKTL
jgi:hypothetical protein